jgi:hypothetical protein
MTSQNTPTIWYLMMVMMKGATPASSARGHSCSSAVQVVPEHIARPSWGVEGAINNRKAMRWLDEISVLNEDVRIGLFP